MYVLRPPRFLCKIPKFTGKTATVILWILNISYYFLSTIQWLGGSQEL